MEQEFEPKEETKVGITQFISKGRQLPALTKYLFSDFIVNEIDKDHHLVALDSMPSFQQTPPPVYETNFQINEQLETKMKDLLGEQAASSIQKLYSQLECGEKVPAWEVTTEKELTKEERKNVHDFVREDLHRIESQVVEGTKIKLKYSKNMKKMDARGRQKYIHFTLYKHGIDTFNALFRLSKIIRVSERIFSTAGLKDKRGHTTQRVSIYNTDVSMLHKFYQDAHRNKEMWISNFTEFQTDKVEVGGLSGNQFALILRLLSKDDAEEIVKRVESLKNKGMINYFGLQRFGQFATKTYEVGILYAKKDWQSLVESVILSDCNNEGVNAMKKELYEGKKYGQAERALHNRYKIEKMLFKGLSKFGENYQNVFESLPRPIKTLYTHSLQSYIWNRLASKRISELGLVLCVGDMVGKKSEQELVKVKEVEEEENDLQKEEEEVEEEQLDVILITADNIQNYTIYDLVLPLLGPQTNLKEGTWLFKPMAEELAALDLTEDDFMHSAKSQNSKAAWRKMLVRPQVVDYELMSHASPKDELQTPFYTMGKKIQFPVGEVKSLRVVLKLPKSAYATMAIREMCHVPSEFDVQRTMNTLYEQKHNTDL